MNQSSDSINPCAFLWDESFLWGLAAFEALRAVGLPFDLIRSNDIRAKKLRDYSMIFVPGGWASNKLKALGEEGVREIRRFVGNGGSYLGFCGGAGLATLDGIGLLNINRVPTKDRVPSFSGGTRFKLSKHGIWDHLSESIAPIFHVWWPSQLLIADPGIDILATYDEAQPDSFSSDLNVGDVHKYYGNWEALEHSYRINLDPFRLAGQPALVEGRYGKGKVVLSLIHFDTPDDANGGTVLVNLWKYLSSSEPRKRRSGEVRNEDSEKKQILGEIMTAAEELISFGERNFLWFWRNRLMLQWKRGIRGLEYCTLYAMIKAAADHAENIPLDDPSFLSRALEIKNMLLPFKEKAEKLLLFERMALQDGLRITYEKSDDPQILQLRSELFSTSKSYGGLFKELLDEIDDLTFYLLSIPGK
ncbi:MAG: BPL-N domain-containing protein [Dissulfurispiraceae bacterium]